MAKLTAQAGLYFRLGKKLFGIIQKYGPDNVYNMDETVF